MIHELYTSPISHFVVVWYPILEFLQECNIVPPNPIYQTLFSFEKHYTVVVFLYWNYCYCSVIFIVAFLKIE